MTSMARNASIWERLEGVIRGLVFLIEFLPRIQFEMPKTLPFDPNLGGQ